MSEYKLQYTGEEVDELLGSINRNKDTLESAQDTFDSIKKNMEAIQGTINSDALKVLWSGSWASGSISIEGIKNYSLVAVVFDNSFAAICWKYGVFIDGGACWTTDSGYECTTHIRLSVDGTKLTRKYESHVVLYSDETLNLESPQITKIIGIV